MALDKLAVPSLGNTTFQFNVPHAELPPSSVDAFPAVKANPVLQPKAKKKTIPSPAKKVVGKPNKKRKPVKKKASPRNAFKSSVKKSAKISYNDYLRAHPAQKTLPASSKAPIPKVKLKKVDMIGIAGGVKSISSANTRGSGKGFSHKLQSQEDTYFSLLIQEIRSARDKFDKPAVSDRLKAQITFELTASGCILNPHIARSSCNSDFDSFALQVFRRVQPIGPTPSGKGDTITVTFEMVDDN